MYVHITKWERCFHVTFRNTQIHELVEKVFANLKYDSAVILLLENVDLLEKCGFDFHKFSNMISMVQNFSANQGFDIPCLTSELLLTYLCVT